MLNPLHKSVKYLTLFWRGKARQAARRAVANVNACLNVMQATRLASLGERNGMEERDGIS